MVTQKGLSRYMEKAEQIAKDAETDTEVAKRVIQAIESDLAKRRRKPAPPPPDGGISLSDAERKYGIHNETICRWVKRGWLRVIERTQFKVFVSEAEISKLAEVYKKDAGRGSWVMKKKFGAVGT